jgi:DNA-binding protein HU-beta
MGGIAMNREELLTAMAEESGLTKKDAAKALDSFVEVIERTVTNGEKVSLVGFGTFELRERKARTGRNPRTSEEIEIPASMAPAFKAGKTFKEKVNA